MPKQNKTKKQRLRKETVGKKQSLRLKRFRLYIDDNKILVYRKGYSRLVVITAAYRNDICGKLISNQHNNEPLSKVITTLCQCQVATLFTDMQMALNNLQAAVISYDIGIPYI